MGAIIIHLKRCILTITLVVGTVAASNIDRKLERAETYVKGGNYSSALSVYLDLYKTDSTNLNLCYKLGVCYLRAGESQHHLKALPYLQKAEKGVSVQYDALDMTDRRTPVETYKYLGDAYHLHGKFEEAISAYNKYLAVPSSAKKEKETDKDVKRRIEWCKNGLELMKNPAEVKIVNLGSNINSTFADYSPRISADQSTMIFTSRRPGNIGGRTYDGGQYFEDIYISYKKNGEWTKAVNMGPPVNTVGNEAAIGISADGQEILIYKDDMGDGNIYSSKLEGDKWSVPAKLNANINSSFWEPAAFLSADGQTLYFVSDRPGGYGGTDIYKSKRTKNGDWGKAVNLGPTINTPYDEYGPFIHPDGRTLFFSSKGHKTMGGYDVFFSYTLLTDEKAWIEPVNVGHPINTPFDDAFYSVSADKQYAFYSTTRNDGLGEKDNYMITFADAPREALNLVKGNVETTGAKNATITVTDNETNEVIGVYHPNSLTGKFVYVVTPGKSHNIAYESENCMFYSENQYLSKDSGYTETCKPVKLQEIKEGASVTLNNVFFDFDESRIRKNSMTELNRLYEFLKSHPDLTVEIAGYADSQGDDAYNKKLSMERAQAVVIYLHTKGIPMNRMTAAGYGKAQASAKSAGGMRNERDRRVELKVVSMAHR